MKWMMSTVLIALSLHTGVAAAVTPDNVELQAARAAAWKFWGYHQPARAKRCAHHIPNVKFGDTQGYDGWTPSGPPCRTSYINKGYARRISRVRLCTTVTHEMGHSLGLHHSSAHGDRRNIMYPIWSPQRQVPNSCHYPDPHKRTP